MNGGAGASRLPSNPPFGLEPLETPPGFETPTATAENLSCERCVAMHARVAEGGKSGVEGAHPRDDSPLTSRKYPPPLELVPPSVPSNSTLHACGVDRGAPSSARTDPTSAMIPPCSGKTSRANTGHPGWPTGEAWTSSTSSAGGLRSFPLLVPFGSLPDPPTSPSSNSSDPKPPPPPNPPPPPPKPPPPNPGCLSYTDPALIGHRDTRPVTSPMATTASRPSRPYDAFPPPRADDAGSLNPTAHVGAGEAPRFEPMGGGSRKVTSTCDDVKS